MHEGIPILNYLVPKEFTHEDGKLTGVMFEKVKAEYDDKGRRKLVPTGEPDQHFECDDVLVAVGQENAFPWIERDIGIEFDKWDMPEVDPKTIASTNPKVFFGGDAAFGPKNIIWAVAHGHEAAISIDKFCSTARTSSDRPPPARRSRQPEDGHPRVELRQRYRARQALQGAACATRSIALKNIKAEVELGFDAELALQGGAALPELRRADGVHRRSSASSATPASTSARWTASPSPQNGEEAELRTRLNAPALNLDAGLYVADGLKTGRVMVKDEDVCLHCGLCAERCPTGAWDMQKFLIDMTHAGHASMPIQSVNDFVVRFANVNGSGSASANELFARSILRMGVPVAPRNIFPSNIQGLPTWYEVRVSEAGHLGARGGVDLMVAMNPQTWDKDVAAIEPGGYLFYDSTKPLPPSKFRDDISVIGMPLTEICNREYTDPRQRQLFKNIIYVGALVGAARHRRRRDREADRRAVQGQGQADRRRTCRRCISAATTRR